MPRGAMRDDRPRSIIRAIRGPITLITVGVLFALNNFTSWGFDKTWPVLLIVFGMLSLMRRGSARPNGYTRSSPQQQPYYPPQQPPMYDYPPPPEGYPTPPPPAEPTGQPGSGE